MNQNLECLAQPQNGPPTDHQKLASERAAALREEEWQLHHECITLARQALELYKVQGEKRLRIPDLARLIDLASRLGRLATGIPTEHIEHAWSEYQNQLWTAQFEADVRKIYGQPMNGAHEEPRLDKDHSPDFSRPVGTVSPASRPAQCGNFQPTSEGHNEAQTASPPPEIPKFPEEKLGRDHNLP